MLNIQKLTHVTQAVPDVAAAGELYQEVFGAWTIHEGPSNNDEDAACFVVFHDLCIKLVELELLDFQTGGLPTASPGFQGIGFQVQDLEAAEQHFHDHGLTSVHSTGSRFLLDPAQTYGTLFEFRRDPLPNDPRRAPGWSPEWWRNQHPLGIGGLWGITMMVADPPPAAEFYRRVFGAHDQMVKITGEIARSLTFFTLGEASLALIESAGEGSVLEKVSERLSGGQGMHSLSLLTTRLDGLPAYFRSKGIGLLPGPTVRHVPHPRALLGARYVFLERPDEGDPRYTGTRSGLG